MTFIADRFWTQEKEKRSKNSLTKHAKKHLLFSSFWCLWRYTHNFHSVSFLKRPWFHSISNTMSSVAFRLNFCWCLPLEHFFAASSTGFAKLQIHYYPRLVRDINCLDNGTASTQCKDTFGSLDQSTFRFEM